MTVTRGIAAAATLAGIAAGTASTAWAAPTMSGHYIATVTTPDGKTHNHDWYFTPCGNGCASLALTPGGQSWGQAHLANGQWTMEGLADTTCPDGTTVPMSVTAHTAWDANTLAGSRQATNKLAACGQPAGFTYTDTLQLRKAP
jgi:hypothetical protein